MARPSRKEQLRRYRGRLNHARRFRQQECLDDLWLRMADLYRGKQWPTDLSDEDRLTVNMAFSTINVIYPSVSVNFPKITCNPNKPEDEDRAVITEAVVNYLWRHHDYQDQFRLAVKDFLMIGHGWLKVGYRYKEREVPLSEDERQREALELAFQADSFAEQAPELAGDLPTDDEIEDNLPSTKMLVVEDNPFVERVSPHDMFVDPEATSPQDMRWIAQRVIRPIEDVRRDPKYKASARNRVQPDAGIRTELDDRERKRRHAHEQDPDAQRVTIWEFYDLANDTLSIFAEQCDEFLVDPQPIPFASGHPYVMLRNYDVPDHFYPMGDLESLEPLQHELNHSRTQMQQARRKFARKYLYKESSFNQHGIEALQSDKDNTLVPVADENSALSEVIAPMPQVPLPPDLYNHSATVENDMGTVTGVSEYQRGQVPETRRTATEAAIISDSVNARAADKLAVVEKAIGAVARKVVAVAQQYVTGDQVARVVGLANAVVWVPYTRDDIAGEFDFEVEAGSTQPMNETVRRQEAQALMNAVAPFIQMGVVNPMELAKHVLQFGFGIKNPSKFLMMPPPMPGLPPGQDPSMAAPPDEFGLDGMGGMNLQPPPMGDNADMSSAPPEVVAQLAGQVGLGLG